MSRRSSPADFARIQKKAAAVFTAVFFLLIPAPVYASWPAAAESYPAESTASSIDMKGEKEAAEVSGGMKISVFLIIPAAAAVLGFTFLFIRKKSAVQKGKEIQADSARETEFLYSADSDRESLTVCDEEDAVTEIIQEGQNDVTCMMWSENAGMYAVLTDISFLGRVFQAPLGDALIIGRNPQLCGITIGYDRSVSGRHCEITARGGRYFIKDLNSSNGTCADGIEITSETEIWPGSVIRMGTLEVKFEIKKLSESS